MSEIFRDKDGNPLKKGILYDLPPLSWPLSFQCYEHRQEGDFKNPEAVFWDFRGNPHYFSREKVGIIATKTTLPQIVQHLNSAKSLVEWLSIKGTQIAQSKAKCTRKLRQLERVSDPGSPEDYDSA